LTKERKLAIQMWEQIKNKLARDPAVVIAVLKDKFCREHKLHWFADCWFCQYTLHCDRCPLRGCAAYSTACDKYISLEVRLAACDEIINALKGGKQ